jgi:hypothetical protein
METIKLTPSINARMMLAVGAGRPEMLPTEAQVREIIDSQPADVAQLRELLAGWAWLSVQLVREAINVRLQAEREPDPRNLLDAIDGGAV